jgi:hypothetical protein
MKKIALLMAFAVAPALAGVAHAQETSMPNSGISPYDGSYWNGPDYDYNVGPKGNPNGNQIPNNRAQTGFNAFASEPFGFANHNRRNAGS